MVLKRPVRRGLRGADRCCRIRTARKDAFMNAKAQFAGQFAGLMGKVGYHVTKERVTRPRPTTLREVPPSISALTNEWLTVALCDGVPGAKVVDFEFGAVNDGTSSRRTMRVRYNDAGT